MGAVGIIGAIASLAGTALSYKAASDSRSAMNKTQQDTLDYLAGQQKKGTDVVTQAVQNAGAKTGQQQIQQGASDLATQYAKVQSAPTSTSSTGSSSGDLSVRDKAETTNASGAQAKLGGYSNFSLQQWLNQLNSANQLGVINNQSRTATSTLPIQLAAAQQSGANLAGLGGLLSGAGGALGTYGAVTSGLNTGSGAGPITANANPGIAGTPQSSLMNNFFIRRNPFQQVLAQQP